jgi:hypothetical protein
MYFPDQPEAQLRSFIQGKYHQARESDNRPVGSEADDKKRITTLGAGDDSGEELLKFGSG